jgi:dTDP-4-dehydrorhamnose reductase
MRILITGANGQLGKALISCFSEFNVEIISFDKNQLDITKIDRVRDCVEKSLPDWIINCAAYTNVDLAEVNINTSNNINGTGPENLALICKSYGSKLLHISTDSVYSNNLPIYFDSDQKTNPINQYSKSKVLGEELSMFEFKEGTWILRTSWLYGEFGGKFIHAILNKLSSNRTIQVVNDQFGQPTNSRNLANYIKSFIFQPPNPGIYHFTDQGYVSRVDFARQILIFSGFDLSLIRSMGTKKQEGIAVRPKFCLLAPSNLLYDDVDCISWQESLQHFLKDLKGNRLNGQFN